MPKLFPGQEPLGDKYKQKQKHAISKKHKQDLKQSRKEAKKAKAMGLQPVSKEKVLISE